jgi:hypothetical protein
MKGTVALRVNGILMMFAFTVVPSAGSPNRCGGDRHPYSERPWSPMNR